MGARHFSSCLVFNGTAYADLLKYLKAVIRYFHPFSRACGINSIRSAGTRDQIMQLCRGSLADTDYTLILVHNCVVVDIVNENAIFSTPALYVTLDYP